LVKRNVADEMAGGENMDGTTPAAMIWAKASCMVGRSLADSLKRASGWQIALESEVGLLMEIHSTSRVDRGIGY